MSHSSNKLQLILIIAIPVVGLLLMTAYYYYVTSQGLHTQTHNHGELINPPKQIANINLTKPDGTLHNVADGDDHWTFLYIGANSHCSTSCEETLYLMRQIKAALGKYGPRVDNVYLSLAADLSAATQTLLEGEYAEHQLVFSDAQAAKAWFAKAAPALDVEVGRFYLIDPRGWVMMYFTDDNNYKEIIKDMKFLMKNS